jgi:hypothetical protein
MAELALEAEIDLLPTDQGGRRRPMPNGFRPTLWFGETGPTGEPELHSAVLRLKRRDELAPGKHGRVLISPLAFETWPQVKSGTRFDIYDGGRIVGSGVLRTTPAASFAEEELRKALTNALEEWVIERFGDRVARRPRLGTPYEPDLVAWFDDESGDRHALVAEVVARKPGRKDVDRLARMMERHNASLGLVVALDEPSAATLDEIYRHGTIQLSPELRAPKIRVVTTRDLARAEIDLLPTRREPNALEVLAA